MKFAMKKCFTTVSFVYQTWRIYRNNLIKKHEKTLAEKEQNMMHLNLQRGAIVKPVLLTYQPVKQIESLIAKIRKRKPFYTVHFDIEDQEHSFWKVHEKKDLEEFIELFSQIPEVYVADGHHRLSTTQILRSAKKGKRKGYEVDELLSAYFPVEQLEIHDYNRVIEILNEISAPQLMAKLSKYVNIKSLKKASKPRKKFEMTLFLQKEWYRLNWKKSVLKKYASHEDITLDVMLLNRLVLKNIMQIEDIRSDLRIRYVSGIEGMDGFINSVIKNEYRLGFCLYPVSIDEIIHFRR